LDSSKLLIIGLHGYCPIEQVSELSQVDPFFLLTGAKAVSTSAMLGVMLTCTAHSLTNWQVRLALTK
jgi:hypothetical protein